jgi:hypothetical protein
MSVKNSFRQIFPVLGINFAWQGAFTFNFPRMLNFTENKDNAHKLSYKDIFIRDSQILAM